MRIYGELIKARLEQIAGAVAVSIKGLVYFRSDTNRPVIDDGTTVDQLMMEKHLSEARRSVKVELDTLNTGIEVTGTLPSTLGGTGINNFAGKAGFGLVVNAAETGLELMSFNLTTVAHAVVDIASTNITDSAFVSLINDIGAVPGKKIFVFVQTGTPIYIAVNGVSKLVLPSGGHSSPVGLEVPANGSIEAKSYSGTLNSGLMTINVLG